MNRQHTSRPRALAFAFLASLALGANAVKSDQLCNPLMCIKGTANDTHIFYELTALTTPDKVGWMAIGFGQQMTNTPMVIVWPNPTTGAVVVSQRQASGHVMPTVVPAPPRVVSLSTQSVSLSGANTTISFVVPGDKNSKSATSPHIYAYSSVHPSSFDPFATIVQHDDSGPFNLNFDPNTSTGGGNGGSSGGGNGSGSGSGGGSGSSGGNGSGSSGGTLGGGKLGFLPVEKQIIAHATMMGLAFMIFLPIGAIVARYRTLFPSAIWFKIHFLIQFFIVAPLIIIGFALGVNAVQKNGSGHINDSHKKAGLALFILYICQGLLGFFIHYVKPAHPRPRPPQNYSHAILGLAILGLGWYNIHEGYHVEWSRAVGRKMPSSVNVAWIVFVVIMPLTYVIGLAFLGRQYKAEKDQREKAGHKEGLTRKEPSRSGSDITSS